MLMWIAVVFFMTSVVLGVLLYLAERRVRDVADSLKKGRLILQDRRSQVSSLMGFDELQQAANDLLEEVRKLSRRDSGQHAQIAVALNSIQEVVLVIDKDNRIVMANPAMNALFADGGDLEGKRIETRLRSADFLDCVQRVKRGEQLPRREVQFELARQVKYFEIAGAGIPAPEGGDSGLCLFVLHDVTRLKALERMRTEFVANVSHELRTPVTVIKGFADALVDDHGTMPVAGRERFLLKIQKNVKRLQLLLEDLLTLTRVESGEQAFALETCSIELIINEIVENFTPRAEEAGKRLCVELGAGEAVVLADYLRIHQVLDNLMENALRYARGSTVITLRTRRVGGVLICDVEDDGCGIPERDRPFVFERFYRVDKGRSRELGGTGLGLSIVKHIIQQHGGEIYLESEEGRGTCVSFELPLAQECGGVQALPESP